MFQHKAAVDLRVEYEISKIGVIQHDRVGTKGMAGSLGGAAIGGVLFGGFGAVVGAVATGNKIEDFKNIAVKFTNGDWIVLENKGDWADKTVFKRLVALEGATQECPI
jgi:hypothetical protein